MQQLNSMVTELEVQNQKFQMQASESRSSQKQVNIKNDQLMVQLNMIKKENALMKQQQMKMREKIDK
jgi:hypothetical protein